MSGMATKRKNIVLGTGLILMGLVLTTGTVVASMQIMKKGEEPGIERYEAHCLDNVRRMGFRATHRGEQIVLSGDNETSPRTHVQRVTAVLGFCPKHNLSAMCAGQECGGEDVNFTSTLTLIDEPPQRGFFSFLR